MKKVVSIDYDELQLLYENLKAFEEMNSDKLVIGTNIFDSYLMHSFNEYRVYTKDELVLKLISNITDMQSQNIKLQTKIQQLEVGEKDYSWF